VSTDAVLADIAATLESWETGEDAAEWRADGGPDELAKDEYAGILGTTPSLVLFDEVFIQQCCGQCGALIGDVFTLEFANASSVHLPGPVPACTSCGKGTVTGPHGCRCRFCRPALDLRDYRRRQRNRVKRRRR
jgi:hypothetical protein